MPSSTAEPETSIPKVATENSKKHQNRGPSPEWEQMFQEDPYKSNEECTELARKEGKNGCSGVKFWTRRREEVLRNFIISNDPFHLPPAFRILNQGYIRLGKKLADYGQARELARESMIVPYDVRRFFSLHRHLDRQWRPRESTPDEEDCPRMFRGPTAAERAVLLENLKRDPGNDKTFVFDIKRLWPVEEEPHPEEYDDPVGPPWYISADQRSRFWINRRRHKQFGSGIWFKETPLPFDNNYDWQSWTQQELQEFVSQFVNFEAIHHFRMFPIRPADLAMFGADNPKLSKRYKISNKEVLKLKTFLAEMTAFKLAAERATEAANALN